ncbi:undecaprenyl-diphosphate phosphatase [Brevibacillus laterosporus]|uniref:undecaprenyl-diphosphate phosphatase n=1 Tax=Brevibacillus laterosporus TaxID=1465 RepID=UPI001EF3C57B|nr:undecaprenyl-diphosphate phosphatase [Brevibacillus laterosporus]MCG7319288.1 undecaprenyl-diphosphate phosphatase [Brevibacillus laterosporus]
MLAYIESIFLGIIQGFTEFLPISSTGHLVLFGKLFGLREAGLLFDTLLHLGTLVAVVIVFWTEIIYVIRHPFSKLTRLLIVGTVPTGIIGLTFKDYFEKISQTGQTIGVEFLATGLILWAVESMRKGTRNFEQINYIDALFIGTLQGAAILPAISRSGLTIAGALLRGIDRNDAARFSFLLSLPAILGACVLQVKDLVEQPVLSSGIIPMLVGAMFAAITGYIAIRWMIKLISSGSMKVFAYYVFALGACIIVLQWFGKW